MPAAGTVPAVAAGRREAAAQAWRLARARARAYALLALALRPPIPELPAQLASGAAWREFLEICPEGGLDRQVAALAAAARPYLGAAGGGAVPTALQVLYHRLFAGPGAAAPPYGSLHLEGRLMGETTLGALRAYARAGLAPAADLGDLPDHAAVEAEFLCELLGREMEAWERGAAGAAAERLEQQLAFLEEHLGRWFPALAARLQGSAETGPYGPLLAAGATFVALDRQLAAQALAWARSLAAEAGSQEGGGTR